MSHCIILLAYDYVKLSDHCVISSLSFRIENMKLFLSTYPECVICCCDNVISRWCLVLHVVGGGPQFRGNHLHSGLYVAPISAAYNESRVGSVHRGRHLINPSESPRIISLILFLIC